MAQAIPTKFYPLFARKSDGHEGVNQKGLVIKNAPSAQQLDRTPNAQGQCDYYRLIDGDEPKHMDWRKKLGGMLLREIGGKPYEDKWNQCILWDFPEGYRLYEHIKFKADGQAKAVKNHSGGGHDRQDAYLYGHPKGPKKRFRSPVEYFPHLLWLSTDETNDAENCTCKLCSPLQLEAEKPAAKADSKTDAPALGIKMENSPSATPPVGTPVARSPAVPMPSRRPSGPTAAVPSPAPKPATPNIARPSVPTPTQLPQPRSIDQQVDAQYGKFLARTGEVTWFHREGGAWGLGLVVRRWTPKDGSSNRAYMVQPLSHPFDPQPPQIILDDSKLKPWLAWSAPSCTYSLLQQNPLLAYDAVNWRSLLSGQYGEGNAEVDASILAVKAVDVTYTLFERLKTTTNMGHEERYWNGIYLGAEKIWNGEPVRLHIGSGSDIMVITSIIERIINNPAPSSSPPSIVQFIGDVYTYATLPAPDPSSPPEPPPSTLVPIRMREDIRWRNRSLVPATHTLAYWKLIASQSRLDISDIKGRWYETSLVFAESFNDSIRKNGGGNGIWMNSRGDSTGVGKVVGTRVEERMAALGLAIPKGNSLVEGFEVPPQQERDKPPTTEMQGLELGVGGGEAGFALDDFMNLESMDNDGMAFDDQFTF